MTHSETFGIGNTVDNGTETVFTQGMTTDTSKQDAAEATWWAEAKSKITTQDAGSSVVVLVEGYKVAEYLTWGGLATKTDIGAAAEEYAQTLREGYLALARGEKS